MPGKVGQICTHPCVQNSDHEKTKKLVFNSPMDTPFTLCHYIVHDVDKIPMRGFYQMKEIRETEVKLLLQLKLEEYVRNDFDYCRVVIPFFNRGIIENVVSGNTTGELIIRDDKTALIWNIGSKWTARNKEVALRASVIFNPNKKMESGDPFCEGSNCYVKMEFKAQSFSHVSVAKNISVVPKSSIASKVKEDRFFISGEYVIWNSWGNVKYAWNPLSNDKLS